MTNPASPSGRRVPALVLGLAALVPAAFGYTRLVPLPAPRISAATDAVFLTASNPVDNLVDGDPKTEFASAGRGLDTFVEFDFGAPTAIAGFRHQDRKNGTIAGSALTFFDAAGREVGRVAVVHPDRSGAVTFRAISPAIVARRVRWQVTKLGVGNAGAVGGAEVAFFTAGASEASPTGVVLDAVALPIATNEPAPRQPFKLTLDSPYAEPIDARLQVGADAAQPVRLAPGPQTLEWSLPVANTARAIPVALTDATGAVLARRAFTVPAFRPLTIYILPHSHVDIGYTEIQTAIEEKQLNNLLAGMAAAKRTADYPAGARFVWNLEGLWAADLLLRRLDATQRDEFFAAVRHGQVALNGMYFNTLTGLCRPEELVRLFRFGTQLRDEIGVPVEAAMISDVPGYTWGTVTAMAQAGIKYFCAAPNIFDRIGDTYVRWENKPFWWVGPSGRERVLVWVPFGGYNLAARIQRLTPEWIAGFTEELARSGYPYDVDYIRWSRGDNAAPDEAVSDEVRDWNASHTSPHFVIASARDAFAALEERAGPQLPEFRGDWTPYWEDGAGSSARETAMNRASSDRLAQAEALWAIQAPGSYPAREFTDAMREILLYDEHTWGASSSVTAPGGAPALEQWAIKRSHPESADARSRDLLMRALALSASGDRPGGAVDVFNASSWPRSGLAVVTRDESAAGDAVTDDRGAPVPSQRLTNTELAIWAADVPAYSTRRYTIGPGRPAAPVPVVSTANSLDNGRVRVVIDPTTGAIEELLGYDRATNLADPGAGAGLNDYLYFNGDDPAQARRNGPVTIRRGEKGPLVASLVIESAAPGAFGLTREITLTAGADTVEIADTVDKSRLVAASYRAPEGKESVNFGFAFHVPDGQVRLEVPFGIVRPDTDQIPGAGKNWFTIDRWADVSNAAFGVTWISCDTPLVEVGGLTANLLNSQTNPAVWRQRVGPTQRLYAWAMNNHWGTNYRAFQEGPVTFRFVLWPHGPYDPAAATRRAIAASQPLLAVRGRGTRAAAGSRLTFDSGEVVVTGIKPADDGQGVIVRIWNPAAQPARPGLRWSAPAPRRITITDTGERPGRDVGATLEIPAGGVVTLRADSP